MPKSEWEKPKILHEIRIWKERRPQILANIDAANELVKTATALRKETQATAVEHFHTHGERNPELDAKFQNALESEGNAQHELQNINGERVKSNIDTRALFKLVEQHEDEDFLKLAEALIYAYFPEHVAEANRIEEKMRELEFESKLKDVSTDLEKELVKLRDLHVKIMDPLNKLKEEKQKTQEALLEADRERIRKQLETVIEESLE